MEHIAEGAQDPVGTTFQEGMWADPSSKRRISYRLWRPTTCRALLVVIHGFGEHGGRYVSFAEALAGQGVCVGISDLWGHGRSGGARGDVEQVAVCARDVSMVTRDVFVPASGLSDWSLFGHSFGGLVAIVLALTHPPALRRMVVQSPLLEVGFPLPRWKTAAASFLGRCWPTCPFSTGLDVEALSHAPEIVQAYRQDPLVHHVMTARAYHAILRAKVEVLESASLLRVPTLLLCGGADRIISVEVATRWFDRLTCEKSRVIFPDGYHELHHEPVREDVLRLVREWLLPTDAAHA